MESALAAFGAGESEMGRLMGRLDWGTTALGHPGSWPQSLRTALSICLQSRFPMFVWWGPELTVLYNDAYLPILGDKHPAALGRSGREVWAEIWPVVGPLADTVMRDGASTWSEDQKLVMERFGFIEETYFTFSYSPIRDESGGVGGVFCACTETTARVVGERRLKMLRRLSALSRQNSAAEACRAAAAQIGAHPEDIPFALIYLVEADGITARLAGISGLQDSLPIAPPLIDTALETEHPVARAVRGAGAITLTGINSTLGDVALVLPIATSGRDEVAGVLVAGVSRLRPLDADYRSFLSVVAGHVGTALTDARAYESERARAEALAEVDRAKTAFFSNVSHEFRTPLTLMLGPLEEALRQPVPAREHLEQAHRNSLRLLRLVNSLLDFSRIEARRAEALFEETDLPAFTAELASVFRSATERSGLSLTIDCPPLAEPAFVDREMWEKIVFNLLSNALKFTLTGGVTVRTTEYHGSNPLASFTGVGAETGAGVSDHWLVLSVSDTGVGIPPEEQARVFERFHRVRNQHARSHEGTGIGLALVREFARLHGGRVGLRSRVGEGAEFQVAIPLGARHLPTERLGSTHRTHSAETAARTYLEEADRWAPAANLVGAPGPAAVPALDLEGDIPAPAPRRNRTETLVLAEDNRDMRDYVRRLLETQGYRVLTAEDGASALELARKEHPSLILSDVMMPRMDGFELLAALRRDETLSATPILLLTARAGEEARIEGAAAGADDYLTKPFSSRELLARVETHLELARVRRASAAAIERERRRLYDLLMQAPAPMCVLRGPQHVFELANAHYLRLIGRSDAREVIGQGLREVLPEVAGQGYLEILDQVYRTGRPFHGNEMRLELLHQGGMREYYVNFVYQPTLDEANAVDGILVHAVDVSAQVTSRREVETLAHRLESERDRLRTSEARYRALVIASSDVVYRMNPDWSEMRRMEGKDLVEDTNEPSRGWLQKYIHPDDHGRVLSAVQAAVAGGRTFELEYRVIRRDGTPGWTFSRAVPVRTPEGEVTEWFGTATDITERKLAEEALQRLTVRSEQERRLYDTILSSTPDVVGVLDLNHRFSYANAALLAVWGRSLGDVIGRSWHELGYADWQATLHDREIEEVITTRRPVRGELPFESTQGVRIYDYIFVPVLGTRGEVEAVGVTGRDVTERKRKENTLHFLVDLHQETQSLTDPDEIMATTARLLGEHLHVDRCAYAEVENEETWVITGDYPRGVPSIVGRWPVAAFGEACALQMRKNEPFVLEDAETDPRVTAADRPAYTSTRIRAVICVPLHKGNIFSAGMAVHQATVRRWTEAEVELVQLVASRCWESLERAKVMRSLRESETRFRFLAESMPQKIFTCRPSGEANYVNPQWLEYTGAPPERMLGWEWQNLLHPEDLQPSMREWIHCVASGDPYQIEHRFRRHDGVFRWHLTRARAMRDANGVLLVWIGATTDIEDQKQAEETLERTVAERTAKLRETIGELESFSYSIAHDMRAPLRSLHGFSEVLLEEHAARLNEEGRGYLQRIATAAGRMDRLIQDVLNYSKIVRGESPLVAVPLDLLLRSIVETYPMFSPERADLVLRTPFPLVRGNEAMLTQVFSNLLGNAVKFVASGVRPRVEVWAERRGDRVRVFVRDNGIGIPADQQGRIFEIFQQAELGYGGTGIGLAIVKKAVERMGGEIGLTSARHAGSTFWVELHAAAPKEGRSA